MDSLVLSAQLMAQSAIYDGWKKNPYGTAEPIDPNQLRDALVNMMNNPMHTVAPDGSTGKPQQLALVFMAKGMAMALDGDVSMWQTIYKELQHDGVTKHAVTLDAGLSEAINGILTASGLGAMVVEHEDLRELENLALDEPPNTTTAPTLEELVGVF